jgi:starch synthase
MRRRYRVLFMASEVEPFAKTGGLADVAGALPKALRPLDIDVRVVMPLYAGMPWNDLEVLDGFLTVPMWWGGARARVRVGKLPGSEVPIYCLEYNRYFDRPYLYGPPAEGYPDNLERFTFLSRGSLELCKALGFIPDVIHCNDWQTALVPIYLRAGMVEGDPAARAAKRLARAAIILTVHNLGYQGQFPASDFAATGLPRQLFAVDGVEFHGRVNLLKGGIRYADHVTTVSPGYAREIRTAQQGAGLEGVLQARAGELTGILMIRAYHRANGDTDRDEVLVPDSSHGTNPATASMAGFRTITVRSASPAPGRHAVAYPDERRSTTSRSHSSSESLRPRLTVRATPSGSPSTVRDADGCTCPIDCAASAIDSAGIPTSRPIS